jgi:hypothetical protein
MRRQAMSSPTTGSAMIESTRSRSTALRASQGYACCAERLFRWDDARTRRRRQAGCKARLRDRCRIRASSVLPPEQQPRLRYCRLGCACDPRGCSCGQRACYWFASRSRREGDWFSQQVSLLLIEGHNRMKIGVRARCVWVRWYVCLFVSSVFSFFQFSCDGFLSHRIPVFFHQTPVVRATACWTPATIGSGTSKRELSRNASSGSLATLHDACQDGDWKH